MLNKNDYVHIGTILKPHGLRGEMVIEIFDEQADALVDQEMLMVELEGGLVPFFISDEGVNVRNNGSVTCSFDDITTAEAVRNLCGCAVYHRFNPGENPSEVDLNDDLTGMIVIDESRGRLGPVIRTDNYSGNVVMTVEYGRHEVLIPLADHLVKGFNPQKRELLLACPEGLIDLYLE